MGGFYSTNEIKGGDKYNQINTSPGASSGTCLAYNGHEKWSKTIFGNILYTPDTICFYQKNDNYYEFANFWEGDPITIGNHRYNTSENYFQAEKFTHDSPEYNNIAGQPDGGSAFSTARSTFRTLDQKKWVVGGCQ